MREKREFSLKINKASLMTPINVLIVEPYPFGKITGNLKTLSYILKYIDKNKFKVHLVFPFESDFTQLVKNEGFSCFLISPGQRLLQYGGIWGTSNFIKKILTVFSALTYNIKLITLSKKLNINVIYCNCIRSLLYIILSICVHIPIMWYIKGELSNNILDRIGFLIANKIVFQCELNKYDKYNNFINFFNYKIGILKSGIDPIEIYQALSCDRKAIIEELSIKNNNINIVTVGTLIKLKGIHYLLEAIGMIVKDHPDVMLYVLGDRIIDENLEYQQELLKIIEINALENNVKFTGWRDDALQIVSLMDILVHPSLSEGCPRAVMEAMALGKPVIATRVGGARELIEDGENGFLVEAKNPTQIAEKISELIRDESLRNTIGKAGQARVISQFSVNDMVDNLEKIWMDLAMVN